MPILNPPLDPYPVTQWTNLGQDIPPTHYLGAAVAEGLDRLSLSLTLAQRWRRAWTASFSLSYLGAAVAEGLDRLEDVGERPWNEARPVAQLQGKR